MEMSLHQLRELLETRREYATTETTSERITEIQKDLDTLENEYAQDISGLLNGTGYNVQSVSFNINIVRETRSKKPSDRCVKLTRLLRPLDDD
jgi:hypothetical protein